MKNLRQSLQFVKGIDRFEKEAMFATVGVYTYAESSANIGRKRPLKTKKSVGFQHITVSFASFCLL